MVLCSKEEFEQFVEKTPNLCTSGIVNTEYCQLFKLDLTTSRSQLIAAYDAFLLCCDWLTGCRFDDYATHYSPGTERLLTKVSSFTETKIPHGALVAAVLYLDLPHIRPGNTPGLSVGVSRLCPRLHVLAN